MRTPLLYRLVVVVLLFSTTISIAQTQDQNTSLSPLLITELYYYAHSSVPNEFITITNPTTTNQDLSGYYLTTKPDQPMTTQPKIIFPTHTILPPNTSYTLTQNATAYQKETNLLPDYEYDSDSRSDVPQLTTYKGTQFSNQGAAIALKDSSNHTIDLVVYGNSIPPHEGWSGPPINNSGSGVILKRNIQNNTPLDTDTASDWQHPRRYGIGQSVYSSPTISFEGDITTFVSPDCSYPAITKELRNATHTISLNMYEFTDPFLYQELIQALERQVTLNIFMEGSPVGGVDIREKYILTQLARHGANIRLMANNQNQHIYARYPYDHAKYLVIDSTTVIIESCNWAKTGVPKDPTSGNREWGIIIKNPEVASYYQQVFSEDWNPYYQDSIPLEDLNLAIPTQFTLDTTITTGIYTPQFNPETLHGKFTLTPVLSPDTSEQCILDAIDSAEETILIEQLTLAKNWDDVISPFINHLIQKAAQGVDIKIIMNYNPQYISETTDLFATKQLFEENHIQVKFLYTNWSVFTNMHNKGMIIDNQTVLISSINWNENSVRRNREAGVLIHNNTVAQYYANVFYADWGLKPPTHTQENTPVIDYKSILCIGVVFLIVTIIVVRDWRRRKWH
ncbi:MAG: phospholipase D-like domain-containing protein [Methanobacteriota archaeon]